MGDKPKVVKKHQRELRRTLTSLRLELPAFRDDPAAARAIDGKSFDLEHNSATLRSVSFAFAAGRLVMTVRCRHATRYRCGPGKCAAGKARPEPRPVRTPQPVRCAYTWLEDGQLEATVRIITTPVRMTHRCRFFGDTVELTLSPSVGGEPLLIRGRLAEAGVKGPG